MNKQSILVLSLRRLVRTRLLESFSKIKRHAHVEPLGKAQKLTYSNRNH